MNINKVRTVTALSVFLAYAGYQVVKSFINNPLGLDIAYKSSINSSRVCEGISTSVLDEISGTRVVFLKTKGKV
ncbi:hypothetical protein HOJ01_02920 [bacterium]|jgi:hypothetical protein|nr:hypothetical protein [bacterium]MBT6293736.1 hypothetical protein [bacterium]